MDVNLEYAIEIADSLGVEFLVGGRLANWKSADDAAKLYISILY